MPNISELYLLFQMITLFFRSNNASKATHVLQKKAARAGARYVYITKMVNTNDGYWWEKDWGEGFVIEAELYY